MPQPPALTDLAAALRRPVTSGRDLKAIEILCEAFLDRPRAERARAARELPRLAQGADTVLMLSAMATVSGDLRYYDELLDAIEGNIAQSGLEGLLHIHAGIGRQLFLMRMDPASRPGFFEERQFPFYRRILGEIRRRQAVVPPARRAGGAGTGRVVLVTNQFLSLRHQPSRDLLSYAALLEDRCGREVVILNTNIMPAEVHSLFVPSFAASVEPTLSGDQRIEADGRAYRMLSSVEPCVSPGKIAWFLEAIAALDPDAVLSLGGSCVVADLMAGTRPTLCIPTTSGATLSLADIVLDFGGGAAPTHGPLAQSWRPFRFLHSLAGAAPRTDAARAAFGLEENAFVCAVVGNRLDDEADGAFLAMLEALFDRVPRAVTVFAGHAEALPRRLAASRHAGRLCCLGYVSDMGALLAVCDAYVNPRRTGGGASAAEALAAGAVPLSLPGGDVASVVGPRFTLPDYGAFVERLAALAADPAARAAAAAEARVQGSRRSGPEETAAALSRHLDEATTLFHGRRPLEE
ncbi:glycosyltransferase [Azospirillum formosense]|uniref:Glycosyltransferase n=1 Tax=Azospirillum formosense TaxID=861533 RepID=A0ABX2KZA9_9PROT|nr:glycosyltransferase [Azospirillum formosense]MBY3751939.1 glycosyltransferase [Azospirillum formosense]NUB21999.1 glycosyltransferase [Azospirillum formosense]